MAGKSNRLKRPNCPRCGNFPHMREISAPVKARRQSCEPLRGTAGEAGPQKLCGPSTGGLEHRHTDRRQGKNGGIRLAVHLVFLRGDTAEIAPIAATINLGVAV